MLWAMTPHRPLLSADLTTACLSRCQTRNNTKAPKLVGSIELLKRHRPFLSPVPLHQWALSFFFPQSPRTPCLILMCSPSCASAISLPADEGTGLSALKRRRVTAEMEGKYIINMPKGTTPRTRRILAQQSKKGRTDPVAPPTTCASNVATNSSKKIPVKLFTNFFDPQNGC